MFPMLSWDNLYLQKASNKDNKEIEYDNLMCGSSAKINSFYENLAFSMEFLYII